MHSPFSAETASSELVDIMWKYAVIHAKCLRVLALNSKLDSKNAQLTVVQRGHAFRAYADYIASATHTILPFRHGIKRRTDSEMATAQRRVIQCEAHFAYRPDSSDTCKQCNLPMWQHIVTTLARYCPTDGRSYWQMARAILNQGCTTNPPDRLCRAAVYAALAPIAVAARSKTAKPARV